ncbi:MAG: HAD-IIB family hydrolase [Opitutales bacterium]
MQTADKQYLLASDLDDTLLGNTRALRRFRDYYDSECADFVGLVYASGRFAESIRGDIAESDLPEPKYIIGGVGTEIRSYPDNNIIHEWEEAMAADWSAEQVVRLFEDEESMMLQPQSSQSAFKVSYLYPNATEDHLEGLRKRLSEAGLKTNIIYSSQEDLDILPQGVDKGSAAKFISERMGFENHQVITAGNSENDAALLEHGFHGIVVANAHSRLRQLVRDYHAYQSPQEHADGVKDGLRYWLRRLQHTNE